MLIPPAPDRTIQLDCYRHVRWSAGHSEQVGSAFVGNGIGAAVLSGTGNEVVSPSTMPMVLIMALSTRQRQSFDLLGRRTTAPLRAESAIVMPQGQESWWASDEPKRNLHIHVQPHYLETLGLKLHDTTRPQFGLRDPLLARLGRVISAALSDSDGAPLFIDHLLLAYVARLFTAAGAPRVQVTGGLSASAARRCIDYLEAHLAEKVTVAELAGVAGLSPFHFVRMFQRSTGHPPARYQQHLRMEKAKTLLSSTGMTITAIAAAVGYDTPSAFARAFRAGTGMSPRRWRAGA
jgi:AraC family transcriptional regulator